jgi:predicted transcriptional regulator
MALDGPEAEGNGVAARVLRYVLAHEGAHFREIQRNLRLATGQADHHLRRLVRVGLLARTRLGGEVHFFPVSRPRAERRPMAALRHPARRTVSRALLDGAPVQLRELVARTGVPESTLLHHLRTLVKAGVVYRAQQGRSVTYGLSDAGHLHDLLAASGLKGRAAAPPPALGTRARPVAR